MVPSILHLDPITTIPSIELTVQTYHHTSLTTTFFADLEAIAMPVTVRPASHPARRLVPKAVNSAEELFKASCPREAARCKRMIRPPTTDFTRLNIIPSSNGLVMATYEAYSHHHHLKIRPEDVWFTILTQITFYINAHAEELRSSFVSHAAKEELVVIDSGSIETFDAGKLAIWLTEAMD
jgi:hypothetical protein